MEAKRSEQPCFEYFERPLASSTFRVQERISHVIMGTYSPPLMENKYIEAGSIRKGLVGTRISFFEEQHRRKQEESSQNDSENQREEVGKLGMKCENCMKFGKCASGSSCSVESLSSGVSSGSSALNSNTDRVEKLPNEKHNQNGAEDIEEQKNIDSVYNDEDISQNSGTASYSGRKITKSVEEMSRIEEEISVSEEMRCPTEETSNKGDNISQSNDESSSEDMIDSSSNEDEMSFNEFQDLIDENDDFDNGEDYSDSEYDENNDVDENNNNYEVVNYNERVNIVHNNEDDDNEVVHVVINNLDDNNNYEIRDINLVVNLWDYNMVENNNHEIMVHNNEDVNIEEVEEIDNEEIDNEENLNGSEETGQNEDRNGDLQLPTNNIPVLFAARLYQAVFRFREAAIADFNALRNIFEHLPVHQQLMLLSRFFLIVLIYFIFNHLEIFTGLLILCVIMHYYTRSVEN